MPECDRCESWVSCTFARLYRINGRIPACQNCSTRCSPIDTLRKREGGL